MNKAPRERTPPLNRIIPATLVAIAALVLWLAPAERTLGEGIKLVYVHVSLTWTGMVGLMVMGVFGLGMALTGWKRLLALIRTIGWVSIAFYGGGLVVSALAAWVNWGGVFLSEPRTRTSLNIMALALIVQVAGGWLPWVRWTGLLYTTPIALVAWTSVSTPLVLHPNNPITTSSSTAIQLTFFALFALSSLAAIWAAIRLHRPFEADSP
jgi:arginine exporter protein ArgO